MKIFFRIFITISIFAGATTIASATEKPENITSGDLGKSIGGIVFFCGVGNAILALRTIIYGGIGGVIFISEKAVQVAVPRSISNQIIDQVPEADSEAYYRGLYTATVQDFSGYGKQCVSMYQSLTHEASLLSQKDRQGTHNKLVELQNALERLD